jgi:hypothetical protein
MLTFRVSDKKETTVICKYSRNFRFKILLAQTAGVSLTVAVGMILLLNGHKTLGHIASSNLHAHFSYQAISTKSI